MNYNSRIKATARLQNLPLRKIAKAIQIPEEKLREAIENKSLRYDQIDMVCRILDIDTNQIGNAQKSVCKLSSVSPVFMEGKMFC